MADHVAIPSQVANPWRAVWRTFWEVLVPAVLLVVTVGPAILNILAEELGTVLPAGFIAWLLGAATLLAALASAFARIAAIPRVNELLKGVRLDAGAPAAPKAVTGNIPVADNGQIVYDARGRASE
ncbi:hypothetical protein [Paenarthrobacter ureafaciens]|uniref:hypothetical protein n=1 Tax=Paenarthrobacter ureafaciens TaxID=37931 RepID=UPI0009ADDC32|nr:hypothetical protein [Paenarthrobacter ureafaciens]GLU58561.1 hypothetical protein Pure01_10740 [Paenarthrobacter ureafaciens]GLU61806.1 hypothetical protein Pure02_00560 [Paenarthrobacter ureafaciens]GLU66080.1 hypothetical protein Pure03_00560 [Paenarthrobacter ureafaciens]GLU71596.1 hypothetical protein Pure04_13110 [Paenarthrobacter ureafaciens]GLU74617.1 hypothetical protein Pure05_00570 [Paenarthrobacter ureafaciens]